MMVDRLSRLAAGARALAALLFSLAGARFVTVSVALAVDEPPPLPASNPSAKQVRQSPFDALKKPSLAPTDGHLGAAPSVFIREHSSDLDAAASPSASAHAETVRVSVVVTAGPPRSLVYVRGRQVGKTPFVGEVTCIPGDPVKIEVVPPTGMPLSTKRLCFAGATLRMGN